MNRVEAGMLNARISWCGGVMVMAGTGFALTRPEFALYDGFLALVTFAGGFVLTSKPKSDLNFAYEKSLEENKGMR